MWLNKVIDVKDSEIQRILITADGFLVQTIIKQHVE